VRTWHTSVSLIFAALALSSCVSWQTKYLKEAANQATMAEVEKRLGRADSTWDLQTGETLWTYQSGLPSGTDTGGITIVGPGWVIGKRSDCSEYVLLFDQQKILRAWMRQPCNPDRRLSGNGGRTPSRSTPPFSPTEPENSFAQKALANLPPRRGDPRMRPSMTCSAPLDNQSASYVMCIVLEPMIGEDKYAGGEEHTVHHRA
jgi:hypothetical protein